jgi:hypothetical protein
MKVRYQEELLRTINSNIMIFIDESSLDLIYSPYVGYDEEKARQGKTFKRFWALLPD